MPNKWGYDDNLFRKEAHIGQTFSQKVAAYLNSRNILCEATELEFAKDVADRERFKKHEQDIIFHKFGGCLEVKSRRLKFNSDPDSYPYGTALVDTVSGWDAKERIPLAVVLISQETDAMLVIPPSTKESWRHFSSFDKIRRINETWYECPKSNLVHMDRLIEFLAQKQAYFA